MIDDETLNLAMDEIRRRGGVITFPPEASTLMTPREFRLRYTKLSAGGLTGRLQHADCPRFHAERAGKHSRIVKLRPTPELIAWVTSAHSPGVRLQPVIHAHDTRRPHNE